MFEIAYFLSISFMKPKSTHIFAVFIFLVTFPSIYVKATPYFTELEILPQVYKDTLKKFKVCVSPIVPHEYMKEDIYLIKWLQATDFNLKKAEKKLKEAIEWRKEAKVDKWEDHRFFSDIRKIGDYSFYLDGVDRQGRPILEAFFGEFNIGAIAASNNIDHFTHYCLRGVERANRKIRKFQAEGNNVTQFILLYNMAGFNAFSDACPTCMTFYIDFVKHYEDAWPNTVFRTILINTPDTYDMILRLVKPLMSSRTRAGLHVFGQDKNEWKPFLDDLIDPKEISNWYDGRGKKRGTNGREPNPWF